jgi:hypothetical protein
MRSPSPEISEFFAARWTETRMMSVLAATIYMRNIVHLATLSEPRLCIGLY